jgi:hypothetical protein
MDPLIVQNALRAVLGDGYEERSRVTINDPRPDAPVRKDAVGSDMHVMTSISTPRNKRAVRVPGGNGKLKPMVSVVDNSVGSVDKAMDPQTKSKVGEGLTTAGAVGGALSLPSLAGHTATKLRQGGVLKPKTVLPPMAAGMNVDPEAAHIGTGLGRKIGHVLKPMADAAHKLPGMKVEGQGLRDPKVGAGLAVGAAGLEIAGLAGDVMGRKAFKQQRQPGTPGNVAGVSKAKDSGGHGSNKRAQGAALIGAGTVTAGGGLVAGGIPGTRLKPLEGLKPFKTDGSIDALRGTRGDAFWNNRPEGMLRPENLAHNVKAAARMAPMGRGGILGYRVNVHDAFLEHPKTEAEKLKAGMGPEAGKGALAGKMKAEKGVLRGMKAGRKAAYGATALGVGAIAEGRHRQNEVRKDDQTKHAGMLGAAGASAGIGLGAPKVINHFSNQYREAAKDHIREATRIAPEVGGLYTKPAKRGKLNRVKSPSQETMYPQKRGEQMARENVLGNIKGKGNKRAVGYHLGAAANKRHFVEVMDSTSKWTKIAGVGGAAALGGAAYHDRHKVAKAQDDVVTFSKVDDDKQQVFGWVSISKKDGVEVLDLQGDYVPIEEIEKSAYDYMLKSRKGGNQHARIYSELGDQPKHVADVIESVVFTPEKIEKMGLPGDHTQGWWMGMQIFDDETWRQVKSGERAGFSIHGQGKREVVEKAAQPEPMVHVPDRKEQAKVIGLGAAGATAAGAGAGSALVPYMHANHPRHAAKIGIKSTQAADRASGRLRLVAAGIAAPAGIYGGLHAVHSAVTKPPKKQVPISQVKKAWSPVVEHDSLEENRQRRAAAYQQVATGAAAGGAAAAVGGGLVAHRQSRTAQASRALVGMKRQNLNQQMRLKVNQNKHSEDLANEVRAHNAKVADIKPMKPQLLRTAQRAEGAAKVARKVSRRGALVAVGAGTAAGVIHHGRQDSWKPYGQ